MDPNFPMEADVNVSKIEKDIQINIGIGRTGWNGKPTIYLNNNGLHMPLCKTEDGTHYTYSATPQLGEERFNAMTHEIKEINAAQGGQFITVILRPRAA